MARMLITGATGLTGRYLLERLLERFPHRHFECTVQPGSRSPRLLHERVHYLTCDVANPADLGAKLAELGPVDEVLHIVQLRHAPALIDAMASWPTTPRLIVVGTTGVFSRFQAYAAEYERAEGVLRDRYPHHVLVRPTMIYGDAQDKNLHKLIRFIDRFGCFPLFGHGSGKLQPIHYQDLASALLAITEHPELGGKAYNLSGGSVVTYAELLRLVAHLLGRPCLRLPVPIALGRLAGRLAEALLGARTPLREEQVLRLLEDKHFDHADASRDFGFAPRTLETGLREEILALSAAGLLRSRPATPAPPTTEGP